MLQECQPFLQMFQARLIDFLETDPIQDHPMVDEESMPGTFHANLEYVGASIGVSPFGQSKYSCPSSGASPLRGCCRWRTSAISPSDESMERKKRGHQKTVDSCLHVFVFLNLACAEDH